jgi:hypothetical protein
MALRLSGLRSAPAAFGAGLFCRMAAMPYPAYEVHLLLSALACFAGWRRCLIRPTKFAFGMRDDRGCG